MQEGTNFALFVAFSDASEQENAFASLSREGKVLMPLQGRMGMVEDRFAIRWMLAFWGPSES